MLLADPQARVVAAAHAGWKGALGGVVEDAIAGDDELGARAERIVAAVGPVIGPASYEVGDEFELRFLTRRSAQQSRFAPTSSIEKRMFDLPGYVLDRLDRAGVHRAEWLGRDTLAEPEAFFSHRRAVLAGGADTGRLISVITAGG